MNPTLSSSKIPPYQPIPTAPLSPPPAPARAGKSGNLVLIIVLVFISLAALVAGFFVYYFYSEYVEAKSDLDTKISLAVAEAEKKKTSELEAEFAEREKNPYSTFSGPEDYGSLTFEYPRTWSVYIGKDAAKGGDYEAYLNPSEVNPVSTTTINALRVTVSTKTFENSQKTYEDLVKKGQLSSEIRTVNGESATFYRGTLPNKLVGAACLIKIRDKTAILQTDAEIFLEDFEKVLTSVTYNL